MRHQLRGRFSSIRHQVEAADADLFRFCLHIQVKHQIKFIIMKLALATILIASAAAFAPSQQVSFFGLSHFRVGLKIFWLHLMETCRSSS